MSGSNVRVGVIGVGRMGARHCRVYAGLPNVQFVGVADTDLERCQSIARKHGVAAFTDLRDLLREVDAVTIATPTSTHFGVASQAIAEGVHVLLEKPLADSLQVGHELAWLARASATVFQVGHIERFNPTFLELQVILQDMLIIGLTARRLSPFDSSNTDIDVVYDLMIHDLDLSLALLGGPVEDLRAFGRATRPASADYVVASLSIADGPLASLTASRLAEQKVRQLDITAVGAYIEADLLNKSIYIYRRTLPEYVQHSQPLRYRRESLVERIHIPTAEPLVLELEAFLRCIRDDTLPKVGIEEALLALELAASIHDSLRAGTAGAHADGADHLLAAAS